MIINDSIKPQDTDPIKPVIDIHELFNKELEDMFMTIFDEDNEENEDYQDNE